MKTICHSDIITGIIPRYYFIKGVKHLNKSDERYNICKTRRLFKLPCKNCIYSDTCDKYKKTLEKEMKTNAKKK